VINRRVWSEIDGDEVPMMTSDDDSTRSSLFTLLNKIRFSETLSFVCCPELFSKVVVTHATGIDD
jgi:hypothetical protein